MIGGAYSGSGGGSGIKIPIPLDIKLESTSSRIIYDTEDECSDVMSILPTPLLYQLNSGVAEVDIYRTYNTTTTNTTDTTTTTNTDTNTTTTASENNYPNLRLHKVPSNFRPGSSYAPTTTLTTTPLVWRLLIQCSSNVETYRLKCRSTLNRELNKLNSRGSNTNTTTTTATIITNNNNNNNNDWYINTHQWIHGPPPIHITAADLARDTLGVAVTIRDQKREKN